MDADKSLDFSILPALRINGLRSLCKARGISYRATAKKNDMEKALSPDEEKRVDEEASSSEGEPVEMEEDALALENDGEEGEDHDCTPFPTSPLSMSGWILDRMYAFETVMVLKSD
ncbi:hypothetical protein NDU88_003914 [Pleurodeles waltl]|uniref:SAP domain-containing protein n=1 Tax=Pleurodeles waltl TaxID=8319 RepID=A0AAV7V1H1_PLEWA|nr:hypothetical protein NDU88_003914 [Pleurodeles waltl]